MLTFEFSKTEGLVKKLVNELGKDVLLHREFEDVVHDVYALLLHELHRFNPKKDKWTPFVRVVARSCLYRARAKIYNPGVIRLVSWSAVSDDDGNLGDWLERVPDPKNKPLCLAADIAVAFARLPPDEKEVVKAFITYQPQEVTAEKLGKSRPRISQIRKRAFKRMRKTLSCCSGQSNTEKCCQK